MALGGIHPLTANPHTRTASWADLFSKREYTIGLERYMDQLLVKDISHIVMRKTKPEWALRNMRHEDWCVLVCCLEGSAEYRFADADIRVQAGDVLFIPNREERSARSNWKKPWTFCSAAFSLHETIGLSGSDLSRMLGRNPQRASKELMAAFSDLAMLWLRRTAAYKLRCSGMILEIIGRLLEDASETDLGIRIPNYAKIKHAMKKMSENAGSAASISQIAADIGLSESRFRHLFKEATGCSPSRYANLKKVEQAKDLLLSGNYNVGETAEELGFESVHYFSRLFKSITGQSPSLFLKR